MSQALEASGLEHDTLLNISWVCRRVDHSRRREAPSFAHAQEVAPLEPEEQSHWLKQVNQHGWNRRELRTNIRASQRCTVLEGRAATMHTVEVSVLVDIEAQTAVNAEELAWDRVKTAIAPIKGAKVIAAHARPR